MNRNFSVLKDSINSVDDGVSALLYFVEGLTADNKAAGNALYFMANALLVQVKAAQASLNELVEAGEKNG